MIQMCPTWSILDFKISLLAWSRYILLPQIVLQSLFFSSCNFFSKIKMESSFYFIILFLEFRFRHFVIFWFLGPIGATGPVPVDVDECFHGNHSCQQRCVNTFVGYQCACFDGYTLNGDLATCQGKKNCVIYLTNKWNWPCRQIRNYRY